MATLPVIDVAPLVAGGSPVELADVARQIETACREHGFFYVTGHGLEPQLLARLAAASTAFFELPLAAKMEIAMARGGRAWRGYFPVGAELTSGEPDLKEGLYFGTELRDDDPRVRAGLPLHGRNLFPSEVPELRDAVLEYIDALTGLGQAVLRGVALSLGLDADYFAAGYTASPTILFRVFRYPAPATPDSGWGAGEHTDYGLLTLLAQDENGGLQVRTPAGWISAPPLTGTFVANIGDMLDRLTGGWYRSTTHRVRNVSGRDRISFPFFFDPDFTAPIPPLPGRAAVTSGGQPRWDGQNLQAFTGTYGDYLLGKVSKVFPELERDVLRDELVDREQDHADDERDGGGRDGQLAPVPRPIRRLGAQAKNELPDQGIGGQSRDSHGTGLREPVDQDEDQHYGSDDQGRQRLEQLRGLPAAAEPTV